MGTRRDVFYAIADPTRREIIGMVARRSLNLNMIAEHFDVTRQAISLQVKILEECGLVKITQQGRERFCEARLKKLDEVTSWVSRYRDHLDTKMDALDTYLEKLKKQKHHAGKK